MTSEKNPQRHILRSFGALLSGFLVGAVLSLGTDVVLHATGIYPPWFQNMSTPLWMLATGYRIVYTVLGCYIGARLAPDRPMWHAMVLGVIGLVLSTVGAIATWNKGPEFGPKWYPVAVAAIAMPCAWAGGKIRTVQVR